MNLPHAWKAMEHGYNTGIATAVFRFACLKENWNGVFHKLFCIFNRKLALKTILIMCSFISCDVIPNQERHQNLRDIRGTVPCFEQEGSLSRAASCSLLECRGLWCLYCRSKTGRRTSLMSSLWIIVDPRAVPGALFHSDSSASLPALDLFFPDDSIFQFWFSKALSLWPSKLCLTHRGALLVLGSNGNF